VRTKIRLYATAVALAALAVLLIGAPAASAHDKGRGKDKQTLRLVAEENQFEFVDVGASGPSLGDYFVFNETLFKRGREVGTSGGVCTATEVTPPYDVLTFQCLVTLSLRSGQITLQGLIEIQGEDDMGPFRLAITGGTGKYRGAGGEATFRGTSDTSGVYKLSIDSNKKKKHHHRH
jgi:Dirigent-like protein